MCYGGGGFGFVFCVVLCLLCCVWVVSGALSLVGIAYEVVLVSVCLVFCGSGDVFWLVLWCGWCGSVGFVFVFGGLCVVLFVCCGFWVCVECAMFKESVETR